MATTYGEYDIGDLVSVTVEFRNTSAVLIDPTGVTFAVRSPAGVVTNYTYGVDAQLVKDAVGKYRVDVNATLVGTWRYRWASTGTGQGAEEGQFVVRPSGVL